MIKSIEDLSTLARKLNDKSDNLNQIIRSINDKLTNLNFGLSVWLIEPIHRSDYRDREEKLERPTNPYCNATLLGYSYTEGAWQLAFKECEIVKQQSDETGEQYLEVRNAVGISPLLKAPRSVRVRAMRLIPRLLDEMKLKASRLLSEIEKAEQAASKL